jgi:DNA primase
LDIGKKKDKFINRLIFPIQNQRGDVVAFAGRVLDKSLPKYLNSPASKIYDKSAILY